jgi:hypothetical protein
MLPATEPTKPPTKPYAAPCCCVDKSDEPTAGQVCVPENSAAKATHVLYNTHDLANESANTGALQNMLALCTSTWHTSMQQLMQRRCLRLVISSRPQRAANHSNVISLERKRVKGNKRSQGSSQDTALAEQHLAAMNAPPTRWAQGNYHNRTAQQERAASCTSKQSQRQHMVQTH